MHQLRVATWNIGGGILGESHQTEGTPNLEYHASIISQFKPDIICLQEAHVYSSGEDQVATLARLCGYPFYTTQRISPSHLAKNADLALGLLCSFPISHQRYTEFPNPNLRNTGPNGEDWVLFDKGFTETTIELDGDALSVINAHHFPLHYFNKDARDPDLGYILEPLHEAMRKLADSATLACVDLNSPYIDDLMPQELAAYRELMTRQSTTPKGVQQDYLLGTSKIELSKEISAVRTEADHFLCMSEIGTP